MNNERHLAALSFLTFVALDDQGKPVGVPDVYPESETEKWFHDTAPARVKRRKERRTAIFQFQIQDIRLGLQQAYLDHPMQQMLKN